MEEKADQKTIFMVDDDLSMCDLVEQVVEQKGYKLISHNRYHGSMQRIHEIAPDLILLDLHLPDGSGLHLCKELKNNPKFADTPVIMLTTREFNIEKEIALNAGAEAFIHKPFTHKKLGDIIVSTLTAEIKINFWGVRGSTPCANRDNMVYGGNTTCSQITIPGQDDYLILDCGSGIRNLGNQIVSKNKKAKGHIFITHPHWDHIQGFPFFKPFYIPENEFVIHMPQQLGGDCKEVLSGQMTYTYFPVTPEMLMAHISYVTQSYHLQEYNGYKIEFMLSNHPVATAIYKIHVGGRKIVFCPDNELVPADNGKRSSFYNHLIEFFDGADLLVHDGQYDRESYKQRRNWGHSAWEEAVELAKETNVKRLLLTHHDPDSTDSYLASLDKKLDAYRADFEELHFAKEGESIKLAVEE